jgi:ABC-type branched-subunit amino acid transport system substrate-binding protein
MMRRIAVVLACVALVATACSRSDSSDEGGSTTTTTAASGTSRGTGAKSATFGDLTDVCQGGNPSGSPTTGVDGDSIHVATFSDVGFAGRPGLNQEFFDTADVFAAWCNDRGGINGRKIVVDKRDAALTNVVARMSESCRDDFVMVGGGATFDTDGVEPRLKCLLPDVAGFVASIKARGADLLVQPLPNSPKMLAVGNLRYLGTKYPESKDHVGVLAGDIALTREVAQQNVDAAKSFGDKVVYNDVFPAAGVSSWAPYAQALKDAGVKGLIWVGEPEGLAKLAQALSDIGYRLDWVRADANHYDQQLVDIAGDALSGTPVYVQVSIEPFENAKRSTATGQYFDAFRQYRPNGKSHTNLGITAWSSWLLFAQAAKSCGNDLTRTCFYDAAKKIHSWTGGGLHARSDPGSGDSTDCFAVVKATPKGFVLVRGTRPNEGIFNCSPKNIFPLKTNADDITTLADVGQDIKSMK